MGDVFGLCADQQIGVGLAKELQRSLSPPPPLFIHADFIWQVCAEDWEKHEQQSINRERLVLSSDRIGRSTVGF